jgi:hypothetical protein
MIKKNNNHEMTKHERALIWDLPLALYCYPGLQLNSDMKAQTHQLCDRLNNGR